jgi:hypothetical protein
MADCALEPARVHSAFSHDFLGLFHHNFRRILAWLAILWRVCVKAMLGDASGAEVAETSEQWRNALSSSFTFAKASWRQALPDWIDADLRPGS